jgi:Uri superfamily endonuclease
VSVWEIYIFMDETVEIEVAEQIGSSSKAVSRTGSSDPRNKIPAQICKN